jgi:hypothetical protein
MLQEPGTDKGIAVIFWENVEDMEANHSEAYDHILKEMMPLFVKPPTTYLHEVVCEIEPAVTQNSNIDEYRTTAVAKEGYHLRHSGSMNTPVKSSVFLCAIC